MRSRSSSNQPSARVTFGFREAVFWEAYLAAIRLRERRRADGDRRLASRPRLPEREAEFWQALGRQPPAEVRP